MYNYVNILHCKARVDCKTVHSFALCDLQMKGLPEVSVITREGDY